MNEVEEYALDVVLNGAQSSVDDDMDEDGVLSKEDWLTALSVAQRIVRWIDENSQFILEDIHREDSDED